MARETSWKEGKQDGLGVTWHENGQKDIEQTHKDGEPEGPSSAWYENGQKAWELTYKDGKKLSGTAWDREGNVTKE